MKINITMDQSSIEEAIRDYVAKNGITSPVQEVKFTVTRKGGTSIDAEVILGSGAVNEAVTQPTVEDTPAAPVKRTAPTPDKPKAKAVVEPTPVDEADPDNVKMEAEDTPPFEPNVTAEAGNDAAEEEEAVAPPKSKSLFA